MGQPTTLPEDMMRSHERGLLVLSSGFLNQLGGSNNGGVLDGAVRPEGGTSSLW